MMQLHKRKKNESRTWDVQPLHLTQAGIDDLEKKLARLKKMVPDLAAETARTAAYGDRSDNAEYKQAKGSLRRAHYQIFEIENQLKRAVAIKLGPDASGTVQLGSTVLLEVINGATKKEKKFQIVGPTETDPTRGRISHESPLGVALIGHAAGEIITLTTSVGSQTYEIKKIS